MFRPVSELPPLALENLTHASERVLLILSSFAVLGSVWWGDDHMLLGNDLLVVPADLEVAVVNSVSISYPILNFSSHIHSPEGIVDSLSFPRHALSTILLLCLQLLNTRCLALLQLLGVHGSNRWQRIGDAAVTTLLWGNDLAGGNARERNNMVIARLGSGVAGWVGRRSSGVNGNDVKHWARSEEGSLVCLRMRCCSGDLDSAE